MKRFVFILAVSFLCSGNEAAPQLLKQISISPQTESLLKEDESLVSANEDSPVKEGRKSCPPGWQSFQGSCYFIQTSQIPGLSFLDAQTKCDSFYLGSSLVALETVEETNFIKQYLEDHYSSFHHHTRNGWLTSGNKINGEWRWQATGAPINETVFHWAPGQPNSLTCLSFWPFNDIFDMSGVSCGSYNRQIICEI